MVHLGHFIDSVFVNFLRIRRDNRVVFGNHSAADCLVLNFDLQYRFRFHFLYYDNLFDIISPLAVKSNALRGS